ncbi:MAG: protein phosphatase 2C domain-containing protein [Planctomycetes bacterium]|nr:protein phosphatase 2C domain-containing protein [Planctomycetota bacterium]
MIAPTDTQLWLDGNGVAITSEPAGSGRCVVHVAKCPGMAPERVCEDTAGLVRWGDQAVALMVADGLGGHGDGEFAARLTLRAIATRLVETPLDTGAIQAAILLGIEDANQVLLERPGGAATTILVAVIEGDRFRSFHAGDSELLITGQRGRVKHQTVSHSPVGYAVESGLLDPAVGFGHEERHVVSNFVGMSGMRVEIASAIRLAPRDTVVLASDGLWDNLHVGEVTEIVRKGRLEDAAATLASRSLRRMAAAARAEPGKPDDLSFILYRPR